MRKQRDLPVTMYPQSRMKKDDDSRRLVHKQIDRKELRVYLEKMEANELIESMDSGKNVWVIQLYAGTF